MINPLLIVGFAVLLGFSPKDNPNKKTVERIGVATHVVENSIVYREELSKSFKDQTITVNAIYKSGERVFGVKEISWDANGPKNYKYTNQQKGYSEGITKLSSTKYSVFTTSGDKKKESTLEIDGTVVFDEYLVAWTQNNLKAITAGEEPEIKIIVPRRLDYYSFIAKGKIEKSGDYAIEIVADNFILRQIVQPIKLRFNAKQELLSIKAMSYIHPVEEDLQPILVKYQ
ncbi:hypothetical protein [Luteibaculum oceani]|uniref:DUF3108 domain-containing protein n=1 Tax=Luteibaculum oceani TaxID=1294296 RepID=A0A5C6USX7_9FLAO|nr:hypothetical protein [Luteibaculum oceani]TXC76089.1 hypothetical protein FRX97_11285 [Luteibaculum oceani]